MNPPPLPALLLALPLLGACAAPGPAPEAPDPATVEAALPLGLERPFTQAFQRPDVLVARDIVIEGPADLLAHVALRQEPGVFDYDTKTTREGLRQKLTKRSDAPPQASLRAQLDNWSLVADRSLTVLQRPGDCPVILRAIGQAVYLPADGGAERREEALQFRGDHGR